jgi:hypothetical protein
MYTNITLRFDVYKHLTPYVLMIQSRYHGIFIVDTIRTPYPESIYIGNILPINCQENILPHNFLIQPCWKLPDKNAISHYENTITHYENTITHYENTITHYENTITHYKNTITHYDNTITHYENTITH